MLHALIRSHQQSLVLAMGSDGGNWTEIGRQTSTRQILLGHPAFTDDP